MYLIYPTLLDSFTYWLNDEDSETQQMINRINRVPFVSEAADRGTCFNEVVDRLLEDRAAMEALKQSQEYELQYNFIREDRMWIFNFKRSILMQFADHLQGSIPQVYMESMLDTLYGPVMLYGYADEMRGDTIFDIKTTSRYEFPKFLKNWQHRAYLHAQDQAGTGVNRFQYLVTDFNNVFSEEYVWTKKMEVELVGIVEQFIEFLEEHREFITDEKIFGKLLV